MEQFPFIAYRDAVGQQLLVALTLVELTKRVDRSQRRGEIDLPPPGKHLRGGTKTSPGEIVAHGRIEPEQDVEQARYVLRCPPVDDVEVVRGDRHALEHSRDAADDDELDARVAERCKQRRKI